MSAGAKESVADYPRPPAIEHVDRHIEAMVSGHVVADTRRPIRVLETHHPPVYYIRPEDIAMQFLVPSPHRSFCEYKGEAHYYSLIVDGEQVTPQPGRFYGGWITSEIEGPFKGGPGTAGW